MNMRSVKVTKVRQVHSAKPIQKPGRPSMGPNYAAQRPESPKKAARKSSSARKVLKQA